MPLCQIYSIYTELQSHSKYRFNLNKTITSLNIKWYFSFVKVYSKDRRYIRKEIVWGKFEDLFLVLNFGSHVSSKPEKKDNILISNSADFLVHSWAFYSWEKKHGALPQAIFFGISLCTGQLKKFRYLLQRTEMTV